MALAGALCPHIEAAQPFRGAHRWSAAVAAVPEDSSLPTSLTVRGRWVHRRRKQLKRTLGCCVDLLENPEMPIPAFLEVRQIPEDDPRTELRGQFGVFATDAIPAYAVIGHYKSWAGTEDEYYRQPVSPLHWIHFDSYCYMSEGTVLVNGRQQPLYYSAYTVGNHTQFINDCRSDPFSVSVSPQRSPFHQP